MTKLLSRIADYIDDLETWKRTVVLGSILFAYVILFVAICYIIKGV